MPIRLLALLLVFTVPTLGRACTIPVFRYALERWELSPYEITVFYEKSLPAALEQQLRKLETGVFKANVTVTRVDVAGDLTPLQTKLWARHKDKNTLPWVTARLPDTEASLPDAWAGPLTLETLPRVLDSPARRTLVEKLSQGATAVFVLLPGTDDAANSKAAQMLDQELARLAKIVQLPEQGPEGPQLRTGVPLKVEFATLKLDRNDPAEQAFVDTLLHSESDLVKVRGPIVLPVFGRGRLLCSLYGEDLSREQIANVIRFMCGECSCQVKELNPGVDLLIAADWPAILEKAGPPTASTRVVPQASTTPPAVAVAASPTPPPIQEVPVQDVTESVVISPCIPEGPTVCPLTGSPCWLKVALAGAAVLTLLTGIWVLLRGRSP